MQKYEFRTVARIFELCACHTDGISVLSTKLNPVIETCGIFMQPDNDMPEIKYPAATVILDLTANESTRDEVADLIQEYNIVPIVKSELDLALEANDFGCL